MLIQRNNDYFKSFKGILLFVRLSVMRKDSDQYCLKLNNSEKNLRNSFKALRDDAQLLDVTLTTDDDQLIQAHRVILSAGSSFFKNLFIKCNQTNMLIYLKGIGSDELIKITDFLYNGETFDAHIATLCDMLYHLTFVIM